MKICYVSSALGIHDQRFFEKFQERGWEIHVVAWGRARTRVMDGISFHYLLSDISNRWLTKFPRAAKYAIYPLQAIRSYFFLRRLLRKIKPDVVHACWVPTSGFISVLTGYHPLLLMPYGSDILINPRRSKVLRMITKYTLKKGDMIICDAEIVKKEIVGLTNCPEEKIAVFPVGIDLGKFNPDVNRNEVRRKLGWEDKKIVIMTRPFKRVYAVEYFLRGIPKIIEHVPEARIILCGDGPLEDEFKGFVSREGLIGKVYFTGFVRNEEMSNYLAAADIYVSSSLSDGTSMSLLEAMACGLPPVVTDVAANKEWVTDRVNGFIVPRRDSQQLSEKIIELLENEGLRQKFSASNIRIAQERANWDKNFKTLERIYQGLIDRRK